MRCKRNNQRINVYVELDEETRETLRRYLTDTGRKVGPWVKSLIIRELNAKKPVQASACEDQP